jgi:hypothetical protein
VHGLPGEWQALLAPPAALDLTLKLIRRARRMTTEGVDIPGFAARPTDLRGMARQIKWAVEHGVLDHPDSGPAFLATADQLEAMAATTVLVRSALLVAIKLHGVDLEDHDEPGLPE